MNKDQLNKLDERINPILSAIEDKLNLNVHKHLMLPSGEMLIHLPSEGDENTVQEIDPSDGVFELATGKDFSDCFVKSRNKPKNYIVRRTGILDPNDFYLDLKIEAIAYEMLDSLKKKIGQDKFNGVNYGTLVTFKRPGKGNSYFRLLEDGKVELRLFSSTT